MVRISINLNQRDSQNNYIEYYVTRVPTIVFRSLYYSAQHNIPQMTQFIQFLIDLELIQKENHNKHFTGKNIYPGVSDKTLTNQMIFAARESKKLILDIYRDLYFVNVEIDAGTVANLHCVHYVVSSPNSTIKPFLFTM